MDCVLLFSISAVLLNLSQALPAKVRAAALRLEHPSLICLLVHSVFLLFPQLPADQGEFLFSPDVFFSSGRPVVLNSDKRYSCSSDDQNQVR